MPALDVEVALLAAEVEFLEQLVAAGILPPGARRAPTAPELRAGVRFAELDRIVNEAAGLLSRKVDRVRDHVLDGLAEQLADVAAETDPWAALERLAELTDPTRPDTIPGLRAVVDKVAADLAADLEAVAVAGHAEALDEARRQGVPDSLIGDVPAVDDAVTAAARANAARVAQHPAIRLLDVAAQAGSVAATGPGATGLTVLEAALDAAEQTSRAGTDDLARQAANVTHGLGRQRAQAALPAPAEVYASELLDSATCGPCATVDGRTYVDLAAALVDYPGAGGYIGCDGGSRCRGTLVLVHAGEAPPTLNGPGDGRPGPGGGPADRTPRGPSGVARPAHIDADGNLIPTPVDKGTPPASGVAAAVDDQGRAVAPPHVDPQVTTVPPATVDRDPELAEYDDDELDRVLTDDTQPMERRIAAADELDQRAAGTRRRVFVEEELDAETLARYEDEREAWERAGGYAADDIAETIAGPGRTIDKVRRAWSDQLEQDYTIAEDATRGSLIRRDRAAEFRAKYGTNMAPIFEGPARVAYYYASPELRDHWASIGGRKTFAEFAVDRGVADAKTRARAAAAARARDDAARIAEESPERRAERKRANARKRRPLTPGERLEQERRRRDRIKARERKLRAEGGYAEVPEED
jgi:hypothetical protein